MAEKAIAGLNGFKLESNEKLYAASLISKAKMQNMVTKTFLKQNLYVRGIPKSVIKDEELKKFFEQVLPGEKIKVKNAKVYIQDTGDKDPIGNPIFEGKQFGFVCFETQKDALRVSLLPPQQLIFNDHPLEVFFYEPKAQ